MRSLFESATIGRIPIRNRVVRSATWEGMCDHGGAPTEKLARLYEGLAEGGVGLIITGYAYVLPEGKQNPGKMGMHDDALVPALKALTARVHARGGKILAQLVHAGGQALREHSGHPPVAPSAISVPNNVDMPAALSREGIRGIVSAFAAAACRAMEAGFDGVQLHGAHGYLLHQFLSPRTNERQDEYGGALGNRARFSVEVVEAVKAATGGTLPVWIKVNGEDFLAGGVTLREAETVASMLEDAGVDAIEVSGGTRASGEKTAARLRIDSVSKEAYHRDAARAIRGRVSVPVGVVGGLRSPSVLEEILRAGDADFVSMSRPFIREPGLVNRWAAGDRRRAACVSCNGCFLPGMKEGGIYCVNAKTRIPAAEEGRAGER